MSGKWLNVLAVVVWATILTACMDYGPIERESISSSGRGLFIVCEGNFMYGNASLSYYDIDSMKVQNTVFARVNGKRLGDVAQSMAVRDGRGYIVVNNSGVIYVIDPETFEWIGEIKGLLSPRYIHSLDDRKAYVTDLYSPYISVFDPLEMRITKRIPVGFADKTQPSTEQMVQWDKYVFTNCWSYDDKILIIDTERDTLDGYIEVGMQPTSIVIDCNEKIWVVTDGGYENSPMGQEPGALYRIDPATRRIEQTFPFAFGESGSELCTNGRRDTIFFIQKHVWSMNVNATEIPQQPFLENDTKNYWYGLAVDPKTSEVYLADAIDYTQSGVIYRYSPKGVLLDRFEVGIIPGAFCFTEGDGH